MSGWETPGRLRMNPPVSRWAVAPSPEGHMRTRQKNWSGYSRWPSSARCPSSPPCLSSWTWGSALGLSITFFFSPGSHTQHYNFKNSSSMLSEGRQACQGHLCYEPFVLLLSEGHLEQGPMLSPSTCATTASCPLAETCQIGPLCPHLTDWKNWLGLSSGFISSNLRPVLALQEENHDAHRL